MEICLVGNQFCLGNKIESESSSREIYHGTDIETEEKVAIKLENMMTEHSQLLHESNVYESLEGGTGIPNIRWSGVEDDYNVLELCDGYPTEFANYFQYCRSLSFEDEPDYAYWKRVYHDLFIREGFNLDYAFDWTENQQSKMPHPSNTLESTAGPSSGIHPENFNVGPGSGGSLKQAGFYSSREEFITGKELESHSITKLESCSITKLESRSISADDPSDDQVSPIFMCQICVELTALKECFPIKGCSHFYCSDCIHNYVASKLQLNITQISCPNLGCEGFLDPEYCQSILPPEVYNRWGDALCEELILVSQKYYCPFRDCSALLIQDADSDGIEESECPSCRRLFCAKCKVPWHSGITCKEFQELPENERESGDILVKKLAEENNWIRCPKCKYYVEKSEGCLFMKCRCGHTFCYHCGAPLVEHYCTNCKH